MGYKSPSYHARAGDRVVFDFESFSGTGEIIRSALEMPSAESLRSMEQSLDCWPTALQGKAVDEKFFLGNGFGKRVAARIIGIMRPICNA